MPTLSSIVRLSLLVIALFFQTGCKLWEVRPHFVPDPQLADYRKVISVQDEKIILEDQRSYEIAGVDLAHAPNAMREQYEQQLNRLVGRYVLVLPQRNGKAQAMTGGGPQDPIRQLPGWSYEWDFVLFPIYQDTTPLRTDVGLAIVAAGDAAARPDDLVNTSDRRKYKAAQTKAKEHALGIWRYQN